MTVRHMKIFVEVYQAMNITQAAARLHMTQPAVTRAIQELERYYGVRLFDRLNRRLSITPCGRQLYAQALHIVQTFDEMEKGLRNWDEWGILRLGATITLGNFFLPALAARFKAEHPRFQLRALVASGGQLQQALLDNRLDLALMEGDIPAEYLCAQTFAQDRMVLILPPGHPLASAPRLRLADLGEGPFLLREPGSAGRSLLDHLFALRGLPLIPLWESASTQAIVQGVSAGLGLSILPEQLVAGDIAAGRVVTRPVEDETFTRTHAIVWHQHKFLTPGARKLMALCRRLAGERISGNNLMDSIKTPATLNGAGEKGMGPQ